MTINIPIETYKRHLLAKRILEKIIESGLLPYELLEPAKKIVQELKD